MADRIKKDHQYHVFYINANLLNHLSKVNKLCVDERVYSFLIDSVENITYDLDHRIRYSYKEQRDSFYEQTIMNQFIYFDTEISRFEAKETLYKKFSMFEIKYLGIESGEKILSFLETFRNPEEINVGDYVRITNKNHPFKNLIVRVDDKIDTLLKCSYLVEYERQKIDLQRIEVAKYTGTNLIEDNFKEMETKQKYNKYVIVDGNNLMYRNIFTNKTLRLKKDNKFVGGVVGCLNSLEALKSRYSEHNICFCFDSPGSTENIKISSDYKANRPARGSEFWDAFSENVEIFKKIALAAGHIVVQVPGYEADDLIGSLVEYYKAKPTTEKIVIYSSDNDFAQLLRNDKVVQYFPTYKDYKIYEKTENDVLKQFNVTDIKKVPIIRSILGDKSDNILGLSKFNSNNEINEKIPKDVLFAIVNGSEDFTEVGAKLEQHEFSKQFVTSGKFLENFMLTKIIDNLFTSGVLNIEDYQQKISIDTIIEEYKKLCLFSRIVSINLILA